jgi:hypothetical protein
LNQDGDESQEDAVLGDGSEEANDDASANLPDHIHAQTSEARPVTSSRTEMEDGSSQRGCDGLVLDQQYFCILRFFIGWLRGGIVGRRIEGLQGIDGNIGCGLW